MNNHYNPYEDYDEIIPKDVQQNLNEDYRGIVFGDSMSDEELAENKAAIITFMIMCVLLLITLSAGICITYFNQ